MCLKPKNNSLIQVSVATKLRYKKSQAIKGLEQMVLEFDRAKHPLIPPAYVAPTLFRDDTPNGLIHCILKFFKVNGYHAEQLSNSNRRVDARKTFQNVTGALRTIGNVYWEPGSKDQADISVEVSGKVLLIRINHDLNTKTSPECRQNCSEIEEVVVSNFDQFSEWIRQTIEKIDNEKKD
jgi:hypothetical protein